MILLFCLIWGHFNIIYTLNTPIPNSKHWASATVDLFAVPWSPYAESRLWPLHLAAPSN